MLTHAPPVGWITESTAGVLRRRLWDAFGNKAAILPTPALTGRHLLSLTREMEKYAPLPDDVQRLIRNTSGQGRVQVATLPQIQEIPGFYVYDMRFAYAASAQNLPCGDWMHITTGIPFDRYQRGRFRIEFEVPAGWQHVGIFMVKSDDERTWRFPDRPGQTGETWAGNAELALAADMGWRFVIREAILFDGPRAGLPGPLDAWQAKLVRIWEKGDPDAIRASEIRAAVRAIVLHTIGALHSAGRNETVIIKADERDQLPADNPTVFLRDDGNYQYRRFVPMPDHLRGYMHPEWSAEIWSRCRARLLRFNRIRDRAVTDTWGALTLPRDVVLGFRTDALYLSMPAFWRDYSELGNFREKGCTDAARPAPHTLRALTALKDEAEREEE